MARSSAEKNYVNFVKGLVTEANNLVFPEGSARNLDNVELNTDGSVQRRAGIDFETAFEESGTDLTPSNIDTLAISVHEWRNVNNRGDTNFVVVQVGKWLYFQDASSDVMSDTTLGAIDFSGFAVNNPLHEQTKVQSAYGKGIMFITSNYIEPFYIEYNENTKDFTAYKISMEIRDTEGMFDDLASDERPTTLTYQHEYNLRNQGWVISATCSSDKEGNGVVTDNPYAYTKAKVGFYPSNADIYGTYKTSGAKEVVALNAFSPWEIKKYNFGNTETARGHFILPAFNRDRTTASGISGLYDEFRDVDDTRPAACAFYAGRAWYAGLNSKNSGSKVYYSQLLDDLEKASSCYQAADPSAEEGNELVATDGGIIPINDIGQIFKLLPLQNALYIFASNGIWSISGTDLGSSFSATKQSVRRITDIGVLGAESVIEGDGQVYFFSKGGIYRMAIDPASGDYIVGNVTDGTIKSLYTSFPLGSLTRATGAYDDIGKKFVWIFSSDEEETNKTNITLIFDAILGAFYKHSLPRNTNTGTGSVIPWVIGIVQKQSGGASNVEYNVVQDGNNVISFSDNVIETVTTETLTNTAVKFLTIVPNGTNPTAYNFTFSELNNPYFYDWETQVGQAVLDARAFLLTSADAFQDLLRYKQSNMVQTFFNRTETGFVLNSEDGIEFENPSSCWVTGFWDWAIGSSSNKSTRTQQAYKLGRYYIPENVNDPFNYGYNVITSQIKLRGRGRALQIGFESERGKDFQLLGWSVPFTANQVP